MKKLTFTLLLLLSLPVSAEIYKCVRDGHTIFSDEPCSDNAEIIDLKDTEKKTGAQFADKEMAEMGQTMGEERQQAELERDIVRLERELAANQTQHNQHMTNLESRLADHVNSADHNDWKHRAYQREQFLEKRKELKEKIKRDRREHKHSQSNIKRRITFLKKERGKR